MWLNHSSVLHVSISLSLHLQVRDIGMESPELLQLVENCPQGGETLIMRMLHILTEGGKSSEVFECTVCESCVVWYFEAQ